MIVEGQVHGGLAQGIGQALLEGAIYDDAGQLLSGSYLGYTMPRAADLPAYETETHNTMCTHNPLGSKGVGEMGAIGSPPAVMNAVVDALSPLGVTPRRHAGHRGEGVADHPGRQEGIGRRP